MKKLALPIAIVVSVVAFLGARTAASQATSEQRSHVVAAFNEQIRAYVALHRQIERDLPKQEIFTDPRHERTVVGGMALAMRAARPQAREGDFFTPDMAELLRQDVKAALRARGIDPKALAEKMVPEERRDLRAPTVNARFEWGLANLMPPCVLRALPELPSELQYQIVGPDLILIDVHADLAVDILRGLLPTAIDDARCR